MRVDMIRCYFTAFATKCNQNSLMSEKVKGNYSLKRKKQPARVILENSCMLKKAATT